MKHIGLFEGEGGFSYAAHLMGWETIAWCEWNRFGQLILSHHYPNAAKHGDITKTDFTIYRGLCDILSGGFPCQPYSVAGKRKGKDDERHLWPEMLRAIREIQPRWVVGENVRGIINWNAGLVFNEVQADLEAEGYKILPFLLPAAGVNAPHERYRTWFVAYAAGKGRKEWQQTRRFENQKENRTWMVNESERFSSKQAFTNPESEQNNRRRQRGFLAEPSRVDVKGNAANAESCIRREICRQSTHSRKEKKKFSVDSYSRRAGIQDWSNFPAQPPVCTRDDGFSTELLRQRIREDSMGVISEKEIDKILSSAATQWRNETIKAGGNAIVPQVFLQICKAIEQYELTNRA